MNIINKKTFFIICCFLLTSCIAKEIDMFDYKKEETCKKTDK